MIHHAQFPYVILLFITRLLETAVSMHTYMPRICGRVMVLFGNGLVQVSIDAIVEVQRDALFSPIFLKVLPPAPVSW